MITTLLIELCLCYPELLKQRQYAPISTEVQVPIVYAGVNGMLDKVPVERIVEWDDKFQQHLNSSEQELLSEIGKGQMTKELEPKIKSVIEKFTDGFLA